MKLNGAELLVVVYSLLIATVTRRMGFRVCSAAAGDSSNRLVCAVILGGYAAVAFQAFQTAGPQIEVAGGDLIAYLTMAAQPVFHLEFFTGERAFVYALLLKATGADLAVAGYVQTIASIVCWGFLAWAVRGLFRTNLGKTLGCALVLLCALREEVLFWNNVSLSESLAYSTFALWIASWIMFACGRQRLWRYLPLATSFLFAFVRDTHAFLVLGAAILIAIACACRLIVPRNVLLSLALMCFFVGSLASRMYSCGYGEGRSVYYSRSLFSFVNVVGGRILVDDWRIAELQHQGMNTDLSKSEIAALAGLCGDQFLGKLSELFYSGHRNIALLERWQRTTGQGDYFKFLMRHPSYLLFQPFREEGVLRFLFPLADWVDFRGCNAPLRAGVPQKFHTIVPMPIRDLLRGEQPGWFLLLWAIIALGGIMAFVVSKPHREPLLLTLILLLSSYPYLLLVWHGDALDVPRHAVLAGIQVHLAFAVALALVCDAFTTRWATGAIRKRCGTRGNGSAAC